MKQVRELDLSVLGSVLLWTSALLVPNSSFFLLTFRKILMAAGKFFCCTLLEVLRKNQHNLMYHSGYNSEREITQ